MITQRNYNLSTSKFKYTDVQRRSWNFRFRSWKQFLFYYLLFSIPFSSLSSFLSSSFPCHICSPSSFVSHSFTYSLLFPPFLPLLLLPSSLFWRHSCITPIKLWINRCVLVSFCSFWTLNLFFCINFLTENFEISSKCRTISTWTWRHNWHKTIWTVYQCGWTIEYSF